MTILNSQLIHEQTIIKDEWQTIELPKITQEVKKQAGKVVLFKLTGEEYPTEEQVNQTIVPESGKILLPLKVLIKYQESLRERIKNQDIGFWFSTHEEIESAIILLGDINQFPLIAVHVEKFSDGRIFSLANQLRTKYEFKNNLRAFGDVLRDQLFFLKRSGFNSYLIRKDRDAKDALKGLSDFSNPYQGALDITDPVWKRIKR
jgi:uncharacterized protein (DUF934 family)